MKQGLVAFVVLALLGAGCGKSHSSMSGVSSVDSRADGVVAANVCPDAIGDATLTGKPAQTVSHGQVVTSAAGTLSYTVTAGYLPIYATGQTSGAVQACLFYFSYTRDDHAGDATWPVTFLFNGGPGAPSDWLHLGGMGPKKMDFGPEGITPTTAALSDDKYTLLANSDLVFIDPISTGYSRAAQGVDATQFNGLQQDAQSVGDFVRAYLTTYNRTASPKYILGESYGGMRLPVLSRYLDEQLGIKLSGIIFMSPWLDASGDTNFGGLDASDDIPYMGYFPAFAAVAWYHQKLDPSFEAQTEEQIFQQAYTFATTDYAEALAQGDGLPADQRTKVIAELSALTGLPTTLFDTSNLRVGVDLFRTSILSSTGDTVAYYDGRMAAKVADPTEQDPYDVFNGLFDTADTSYFTGTLGVTTDLQYASNNWTTWPGAPDVGGITGGYINVLDDINTLLANNPQLKVFIANGYFDMVCPAGDDLFMINHLAPAAAARFEIHRYPGGHPIYFSDIGHQQFASDIVSLYAPAPVTP